jgi:hypothetical protein
MNVKKLFIISAPNYLPNNLLKYCTKAVTTLYIPFKSDMSLHFVDVGLRVL